MLIYEKWIKLAALRKPKEDTHVRLGTGKVFKPGIKRGAVPYGENIHGADCICDCDGGPSDVCPAHCTVAYRQKPVRTVIWRGQEEETGWSGRGAKEKRGT